MTVVTIELPDELVQELQHLADARGAEPRTVAAEVLNEALRRRELARADFGALLDKIAARREVSGDGLTEDEAMELVLTEQRAYRAERSASCPAGTD